ncbi:MAG: tetratricopeptide repeat protein [Deltaproteobacteria bacterium]|nr:tetratricopeptide repeat protein [Deltaproteobacteria bacterium]
MSATLQMRVFRQPPRAAVKDTYKAIRPWLLVIFLVALTYRCFYFLEARQHPLFLNPVIDAEQHHAWAQRISSGLILGSGPDDVFKPCFYPLLLGGLYYLWGPNIAVMQWLQFILGSLSAALTALLGAALLGKRAGIAAGFVCALYAPFLFFEGQLLTPAISIFLNLLLMLMLIRPSPRWGRIGVLGGVAAGFRPDMLIGLILVCAYRLLGVAARENNQRALIKAAFLVAGFLAVAVPVMARNYAIAGQWVFFSSNGGINFYTGNRQGTDGVTAIPTGLAWEQAISTVPEEILPEPGSTSRLWFSRGLEAISDDPLAWLKLLGKKAFAFFNGMEFRNNIGYNWFRQDIACLKIPFVQYWPVSALGLLGMVLGLLYRKKAPQRTMILLWIAGYFTVGLIFFVTARFRLPAVPFMMILAAWALFRPFEKDGRSAKRFAASAFLVLLLLTLTWPGWFDPAKGASSRDYINLGNVYRKNKKPQKAIAAYSKAYGTSPLDAEGWFLAGTTYLNARHIDQAVTHLTKAARLCPTGVDILLNLGNAHYQKTDFQESERYYHALIALDKDRNLYHKRASLAKAHLGLWRLYSSRNKLEEAQRQMEHAWARDKRTAAEYCMIGGLALKRCAAVFEEQAREEPWNWYPRANLGMAYFKMGRFEGAAGELKKSAALRGALPGVRFYLGLALIKGGKKEQGRKVLESLLHELPGSALRSEVQKALNTLHGPAGK